MILKFFQDLLNPAIMFAAKIIITRVVYNSIFL